MVPLLLQSPQATAVRLTLDRHVRLPLQDVQAQLLAAAHALLHTHQQACVLVGGEGGEVGDGGVESFHERSRLVVKSLRFTVALFVFHIGTEQSPIWVCVHARVFFSKPELMELTRKH